MKEVMKAARHEEHSDPQQLIEAVKRQQKSISHQRAKLQEKLRQLRQVCLHENTIECPYESGYLSTSVPLRLCVDCGIEEEGWGAGWQVLETDSPRMVSRHELYAARSPGGRELWGWCYGNRFHQEHPVPKHELTHSDGTRCCHEHSLEGAREKIEAERQAKLEDRKQALRKQAAGKKAAKNATWSNSQGAA